MLEIRELSKRYIGRTGEKQALSRIDKPILQMQ